MNRRTRAAFVLLAPLACASQPQASATESEPSASEPEPSSQGIPAPECAAKAASLGDARFDLPDTLPAGQAAAVRITDVHTTTEASLTVHLMGPSGQIATFPVSAQPAFEHRWLLGCDYGSTPPDPPECRRPLKPGEPEDAYVTSFELAPDLLTAGRYALHVCGPLDVPPHVFDVL